jgi:hypothetical protein
VITEYGAESGDDKFYFNIETGNGEDHVQLSCSSRRTIFVLAGERVYFFSGNKIYHVNVSALQGVIGGSSITAQQQLIEGQLYPVKFISGLYVNDDYIYYSGRNEQRVFRNKRID